MGQNVDGILKNEQTTEDWDMVYKLFEGSFSYGFNNHKTHMVKDNI